MDRLFRCSGLMRPKWDEHRGDQTYGQLTIAKALLGRAAEPRRATVVGAKTLTHCQPGKHPLTELGNARRFVELHGCDIRYVWTGQRSGYWIVWNGQRWIEDRSGQILERAKATVNSIWQEAGDDADEKRRVETAKWWRASSSERRIAAMIMLARSEPCIPVQPGELDNDPFRLNCLNGTLDLRSGSLHPHARESLQTRIAPVHFDPNAACPTWERFIAKILNEDAGLLEFMQRSCGHFLTGDVREQVIWICWGHGANGKSTLFDCLRGVMGDYAATAPPDLLTGGLADRHPTELADLQGRRLIVASESEEGRHFRIALVKQLTGDASVKARRMREDFFEFPRTFKLVLHTNHKPVVRESTLALWRRVRLIPFTVTIPPEVQDKTLPSKLRDEWPGILAWSVRGCRVWMEEGLPACDAVALATREYRQEQDVVEMFIEERCVLGNNVQVGRTRLWQGFSEWSGGQPALGRNGFYECIRGRADVIETTVSEADSRVRGFAGIGLRAEHPK